MDRQSMSEVVSCQSSLKEVDIIWNITRVCMWDCRNCCVDALHVVREGSDILIKYDALTKVARIPHGGEKAGSIFDQAAYWLEEQEIELGLKTKLRILDHLGGFNPKLDFSGGDPLAVADTLPVMREAARRFGKSRITLTATGSGMARCRPSELLPLIGELNFTYDNIRTQGNAHRPGGYADGNLRRAKQFADAGIVTRAECPLSAHNCDEQTLRRLYLNLHEAGMETLLLMRLFPVGRGSLVASDVPTATQYRRAIDVLREMQSLYVTPKIKLQCALRFFDSQDQSDNPCDLMRESFGLTAAGVLIASPWAIEKFGKPLDDAWILGNLAETPLKEILESDKALMYLNRLDDNWGHCKIFSFLNSRRIMPIDRIFDKTDPLYSDRSISSAESLA